MTALQTTEPAAVRDEQELLREYLQGRSALCPNCRYDLRDLTGQACPECGEPLVLRVNLVEPRLAAFIAGLVALSASTGFSGLLTVFCVVFESPPTDIWLAIIVPAAVSAALLVCWLRARQWLRARLAMERMTLLVGCCVVPLANIIWFGVSVG